MSDDTACPDAPEEYRSRSSSSSGESASREPGSHCVVLGASIGGLFAARVLSDTFDRVTLLDRDTLPETDENRRGVPQGRHAHAILPAGTKWLQEMFPGLLEEFEASGVPVVREPTEMHFAPGGHLLSQEGRYADPIPTYQPSRPQLEGQVRCRLRELPNVEVIDRSEATGLISDSEGRRVTGVRVVHRDNGVEQDLAADLVVDATGRGGRTTRWLADLGYDQPQEDRVAVDIKYVSRNLRVAPGSLGRRKVVIVGACPGRPTGATFLQHGEDHWMLTLIGYGGHHPPTDPSGFLDFAKPIVPPDVFEALCAAEPLDDPVAHRYPASVRRRYERLERFPDGLLVFGDAICSFNPVYGQGMSAAALQAGALKDALAQGGDQLPRRFFKAAARRIEVAWQMAVGSDLALPEVAGPRPLPVRLSNAFFGRLMSAAEHDSALTQEFVKVSSLLAPPTILLKPATIGRVVLGNLRRRGKAEAR
ncbi:FAD-binding protein [Streptomyces sp. ISL-22]|uniref:FAD-dependent oxidoreductase n=1 Tax=unclassified Streptomyces TaxID=2593676 RepID=UPI001BEAA9E9|nr:MULTISPECIES: FAD-binding protein [unclassified Streptomyces]MBT2421762.1 FAD-binding protein [Streptomyces sp. ISL-24]MBT2436268.1 FAD-binding protein [Streptomyces sp. ISL-22]